MRIAFDSQVVLVTGASKGIGLACARAFAQAGARVVGVSRSRDNLREATRVLADEGLALSTYAADLSDGDAARLVVERIEEEVGPISVLVNSAGAAKRYSVDELSPEAFHQAMNAKYFTYMNTVEPVARRMAERGAGSIVNVVGQGGKQAGVMHIAGGSANAGLMLASVGYARALAAKGVRVNVINPGLTQTSRVEEGLEAAVRATGRKREELLAEQLAGIPMGRAGQPEEVANVALFLASPFASYVSGAVIPMDGCSTSVI
ncbi:SDR family oxidoreductase [Verticiella sediminum]|uniref:SDR family oxidoreductase n=1 Tax=Verticiella sediminum TaxID=1247510 RepID=A0A556AWJ3_9BURK|nr:SDR family oxidoreductase [Verticiella sediminum]TSH97322.1 SDR family oxidoreductase [Verticiella sediminum]